VADQVLAVVQARMGSSRLPGKVLMELSGQPALGLLLDRLTRSRAARVVVATSIEAGDDPIEGFCEDRGVQVVRGSESDVLGRFIDALDQFPASHVVRITGDCPLVDPAVVDGVVELHLRSGADYTTNVLPRTFPKGLDAEVVRADALRVADAEAEDPLEREHVTPFLYRRPERFRLANLRSGEDLGDERWTLDTAEDLETLRSMVAALGARAADAGWPEVVSVVGRRAPNDGLRLRPATLDDSASLLRWRNAPDTVRFSVSGRSIGPDEHAAWLQRVLSDPAVALDIIEEGGSAIGMVRVDVSTGSGTVGISIDPSRRGKGLGRASLATLIAEHAAGVRCTRLVAQVHQDNVASLRSFEGVGFERVGTDGEFVTLVWSPQRPGPREGLRP
jgi:spore coat polysaccharide biosynthesis protein SpsF